MRIRIKRPCDCAPEGHTVVNFKPGDTPDLPDWIAKALLESGAAVRMRKRQESPENKAVTPAETK